MADRISALLGIARRLRDDCDALTLGPPAEYVYNPLRYAWGPFEAYLRRYAHPEPEAVLLGMNPGPFGMMQTGVPFGEIGTVREWLGIEGAVSAPARLHPKRPVEGFDCRRKEVSGSRVWGWAKERFHTPEAFFARFFVLNYCPLVFFDQEGGNQTPDKLKAADQAALFQVCDRALRGVVEILAPGRVIGIGRFAEERARQALAGLAVPVSGVTHPSPANPKAHAGWGRLMDQALGENGIALM